MPSPAALPPLDAPTLAELRRWRMAMTTTEDALRFTMVELAQRGMTVAAVARSVERSRDTVERVLSRFRAGGLAAVPRRRSPGRPPTVPPAWTAELRRVVVLTPRAAGVAAPTWTTTGLAAYLAEVGAPAVSPETVRRTLHRLGYYWTGDTWVRARPAGARGHPAARACGGRMPDRASIC